MTLPTFYDARVRNAIVVHDTLDTFFEEFERKVLPKELGGAIEGINDDDTLNRILSKSGYFQELEKYIFRNSVKMVERRLGSF